MTNDKKLRRSSENKMIAGVAAGVGEFFDIDPTVVRIVWALMVVFAGFGLFLYLIMWIVVPEGGSDLVVPEDDVADPPSVDDSEDE